ncbi:MULTISPECIES: phage tail protein [Paenibacillus]|uniref:phage tail protein n=1 Tax=Paenibacillus TaxID=44249 RepID=UPI002FE408D2
MASKTPNLDLLKKDPVADGNDTFNIETMLNENWDKIDAAVGNVSIPDASLTEKGKVQLSNATNSSAEDMAATPKAVKDATLEAKSYTDQQIGLVTETGIPKLVSYPLKVVATVDNQTVFEIPLDLFDANTDTLLLAINRAFLDSTQYTISNTVRDESGTVTRRAQITLLSGVAASTELMMMVFKNVPIGSDGAINGAVLAVDTVPMNRVSGLEAQLNEVFQAGNERKAEVVAALVALGISASASESWDLLIDKMATIIKATGNAGASELLEGKTASNLNGSFTGTMPNRGGVVITPSTMNQAIPMGYHNGGGYVVGDPALTPTNLPKDVALFGVQGALERLTTVDRDAMIAAIASKGVSASPSDTNAQLAEKIAQIRTGLQFQTVSFSEVGPGPFSISNLPFKPEIIMVRISMYFTKGTSYWTRIDGEGAVVFSRDKGSIGGFRGDVKTERDSSLSFSGYVENVVFNDNGVTFSISSGASKYDYRLSSCTVIGT